MRSRQFTCLLPILLCCLAGCDKIRRSAGDSGSTDGATENIDDAERAAAMKLRLVSDPVREEASAFRLATRKLFDERRFDDLEKLASELRANKSLFRNGSWKIWHFYESFEGSDEAPEKVWKEIGKIHQDWLKAKPASITAHVALGKYFVNYAWYVRGSGYASSVSDRRADNFEKRLASAVEILKASRDFPEKDPMWWNVALSSALGQGWEKQDFDSLVEEAAAFEPKFYHQDNQRAYSLLPRWYGEPGDWEAHALKAAGRKDGLGAEVYARIVIGLRPFHSQIFRNTKASWPKTKEGLQQMRVKYPDSLEIVNEAAYLATLASDQSYAKEMFDLLDDTYVSGIWPKRESYAHYRHWSRTGQW